MIFGFITALLTAGFTVWLVTPLMRQKQTAVLGWLIVLALPVTALLLYAWLGQPALIEYWAQ